MAETLVKVEGLRELQRKLLALPAKLQGKPMSSSLHSGAGRIREAAQKFVSQPGNERAPADASGFLRAAIIQYAVKKGEHQYSNQVRIGIRKRVRKGKALAKGYGAALKRARRRRKQQSVTPRYWRFLEFGTSRMAARPFLRPAFEFKKRDAADVIKQRMREEIEKAASRP